MVGDTRASTLMTRSRATGHSSGSMAGSTKANGRMGGNTASEFTQLPKERLGEDNGKRERGSLGLIEIYCPV